ncbi:FACT complex subunit SPT16 [Vitis vinifera]|uniref:FACT complex subunit n=1 Tax=Vitis vinifera TaxID=29760 RepID=A0A438GZG0_VITVI|nr:FACT complex subunit SPT16 [Vitis vinifera]
MAAEHRNEHSSDLWGSSDALAIATPPASDDLRYLKSSALNIWLLGYEFPETIMVFMKKQIHFLCSQKKASLLEVVRKSAKEAVGVEVVMHVKAKRREAPEGKLLEMWTEKLKNADFQLSDITNGFSDLFAMKDSTELTNVKKAAFLTSSVMKHFVVPKLEKVIDEEKKVSHSSLMDDTEKAILEPARVKVKLKAENVDICYPPIFQSGGEFDLRPSASSNDENLYYDSTSVIICAIAHEAAIGALKPGNKVSAAYQAALAVVEKDAPELVSNLTKSAGTGIGLEFQLADRHQQSKDQKFSVLLADSVIVGEKGPEVVTSISSKAVKDVAYSFNEDDDEEEEERPKVKPEANGGEAVSSKATLRSDNQEMSKEELRRQHQAELARQKNEETARRLAGGGSGAGDNRGAVKATGDLIAYKNVNDLPPPKELMIQVDQKNEAILLPIYGSMVPFHVATVKSVSSQQDTNRTCYIRIIFNVPGTPFSPHDSNSMKFQGSIYLKEVSFRSKDPRHISEVVQMIKTLRRQVASRESERAERATLVTQEKLQLAGTRFKPIRLSDLWIRPSFGGRGRKLTGSLESHTNGFRYSTSRPDERVDIMYGNIKHAFFQPAEKEMITLLHFHLHNHIMVGNKKTKDVQFFVEVMDVVQTLGGGKRSAYDPDEIEEEQRERDRKNKINMDFQNFVNRLTIYGGNHNLKGLTLSLISLLESLASMGWHQGVADTTDLKYYESRLNLNWRPILKTITEDPEKFIEDGGWEFLNLEVSDSDSENSQESDQGYEPSDVQSDTGSEEEVMTVSHWWNPRMMLRRTQTETQRRSRERHGKVRGSKQC